MKAKSLDDVPNEILLEIVQFVGEQTHLPRKYRVLYNLSLVNRSLRAFAYPLLDRKLCFSSSRRFLRVVDYWERVKGAGRQRHESHIRSITIGDPADNAPASGNLHAWSNCIHRSPFLNLASFACLDASATADVLERLSDSKSLTALTLVWGGKRDLDLQRFKVLEALRIYVDGPRVWRLPSPLSPLATLTKLVVHDNRMCRWSDQLVAGARMLFPKLRVLRLDECPALAAHVFDFVQRHPTLLEVSVSLCDDYPPIRLEAVKKLIEGTGTWGYDYYEDGVVYGETNDEVDFPHANFKDDEEEVSLHYKNEFPDVHIQFVLFAFTRIPITETATSWRSGKGSIQPRYKTTGLAFRIMDQERWQSLGMPVAYVPDVLSVAKQHFPDVTELRVSSDTPCWEGNFIAFMKKVAVRVGDLTRLRRLSMSWTIPDDWTWDGPHPHPANFDDNFLQLDAVVPPTERCTDPADSDRDSEDDNWVGKGHSLDELRVLYVDEYVDSLIDELRAFHGADDVDTGDDSLYIRTWEAFNEPRVAKAMRLIAESCLTMEQIDWYPTGMDSMAETTRWRWTVHRDDCGGVRYVSGNLTWKGCTRDPSAAMHILLGEELDYEEARERRCW